MKAWTLSCRGGAYDGLKVLNDLGELGEILVVWRCVGGPCHGHATFEADNPDIVLATAEPYRRTDEIDLDARHAVYATGEGDPEAPAEELEELALAGVGPDLGDGWPVAQ